MFEPPGQHLKPFLAHLAAQTPLLPRVSTLVAHLSRFSPAHSGLFVLFSTGFVIKTGGSNGFHRFACMSDLLSDPDRPRLRFPVEPAGPVRF